VCSKKLVSGIRSTGNLHIGNYYGAMKGLVDLQAKYDAHFFIADIHSLTTHPEKEKMKQNVIMAAEAYLSAGLNPEKCTFYAQSSIAAEICELHTYLSMVMPLGELLRCPTFKEKAKKHPENVNYGLVGYPVLMTADILIHEGEIVPVGEDQIMHLELARSIVRRFNSNYGNVFKEPNALKTNAVRIPSLNNQGKMSKSDREDTYISLDEDDDQIAGKVKKAYSDPTRKYKHEPGHPTKEGCNVFHFHSYFSEKSVQEEIQSKCIRAEIGCVQCKEKLTKSIQQTLAPMKNRREKLNEEFVYEALRLGSNKARANAQKTIQKVRDAIGITMF
jgi:tryptophanyl-tRNA synthetase